MPYSMAAEEKVGIGQEGGNTIQTATGQQRLFVQSLKGSSQHYRRIRGQRRWHESLHRFAGGAGGYLVAGGLTPHGRTP